MKLYRYIYILLASVLASACSSDDIAPAPDSPMIDNGSTFTIRASVEIPGMAQEVSRAMGTSPDYTDQRLYLVEFDIVNIKDDKPLNNFIQTVYEATDMRVVDNHVEFNVTLNKSENPKALHLIAVPKSVELNFNYGSEGTVIPGLTTSENNDAYWKRVTFPNGYGTQDGDTWTLNSDVIPSLTMVPMLRNFAQISMNNEAQNNFTLTGFAVLNTPQEGSVAPWDRESMTFPDFLEVTEIDGEKKYGQKDYANMSYSGLLSGSINEKLDETDFSTDPKFIYERPYSSIRHTQVIIRGKYNGAADDTYYKIDLGTVATDTGIFTFYNLLRNFNYVIKIKNVSAAGAATLDEAITKGVVYNNLSFDISTEKMFNISDGKDMLWVNFTTAVVTSNTDGARTLRFAYRYKEKISTGGGSVNNGAVTAYKLEPGAVIESVKEIASPADSSEWKFYEIKTKAPSNEAQTQSFVVSNPNSGLARTINLVLRNPWEISRNRVFAGTYSVPKQFPYKQEQAEKYENKVNSTAKSPITVFFTIPDNLPEAIFPLSFVLEANPQNFENNKVGTLVVKSGSSLFGTTYGTRIQYVKTITWTDYNTVLDDTHPTGVLVPEQPDKPDETKMVHRVRCRFTSINDITADQTTTIRISNPYFIGPGTGGVTEVSVTSVSGLSGYPQ